MYEVDEKDQVVELKNVPQPSAGTPDPLLFASEYHVMLVYYLSRMPNQDGGREAFAVVRFKSCYAHMFGPPNDEALNGHPLFERGLMFYGVFEIQDSSWLRKLEKMNSVHDRHDKQRFMCSKKHFIFTFHDSTFECIAEGLDIEVSTGSYESMLPRLLESIR